jgi:hypothetical protein
MLVRFFTSVNVVSRETGRPFTIPAGACYQYNPDAPCWSFLEQLTEGVDYEREDLVLLLLPVSYYVRIRSDAGWARYQARAAAGRIVNLFSLSESDRERLVESKHYTREYDEQEVARQQAESGGMERLTYDQLVNTPSAEAVQEFGSKSERPYQTQPRGRIR